MKCFFILLCFVLSASASVFGQAADSLHIGVGTTATVASQAYQPLWLVANQYGAIADRGSDIATHFFFSNTHVAHPKPTFGEVPPKAGALYVAYGLDVYANNKFDRTFLQQAFLKAGYKALQVRAGRYKEVTGELDPTLSSGGLGISGNALPIPKVGLAIPEYTDLPLTRGFVQIKGEFTHGWLGDSYYAKDILLHQKSLYLKFGRPKLSFYAGLTHFAQWGGTFESGQAPGRLQDYVRVVLGSSGNGADPVYQHGPIDIVNAVGNHIVIPDFGINFKSSTSTYRLYTETIFDKGKGKEGERDKLMGLKVLSRDRLLGLSWARDRKAWLSKIVLEGLYTKYQGGPIIYDGRDNYYNNGTYVGGWQYKGDIIGTPLFINSTRAALYGGDFRSLDELPANIVSNRMAALHLGLQGNLSSRVAYRGLFTYAQHSGTYYNKALFPKAKKQVNMLLEGTCQVSRSFVVAAALGLDSGDLSHNTGGKLTAEWLLAR